MAQYKVPQDVEADDKLLGPFSFRQFIYLIVVAGLIALAWALFQVFPLLVIIPLPFILFFGALALPIRKDQPMETYLAAIVSFYLKPRKRLWRAGQPESTIEITAPKTVEKPRTRDLSGEEATHRLSFLAEIVDSEGHAIKGSSSTPMREEFYAEATKTTDMFDPPVPDPLTEMVSQEDQARHAEVVAEMKEAISEAKAPQPSAPKAPPTVSAHKNSAPAVTTPPPPPPEPTPQKVALANDEDLSIATIAKEANRRKNQSVEGEVYISLH